MALSRATRTLMNAHITSAARSGGALWDAFESRVAEGGREVGGEQGPGAASEAGAGPSASGSASAGPSPTPSTSSIPTLAPPPPSPLQNARLAPPHSASPVAGAAVLRTSSASASTDSALVAEHRPESALENGPASTTDSSSSASTHPGGESTGESTGGRGRRGRFHHERRTTSRSEEASSCVPSRAYLRNWTLRHPWTEFDSEGSQGKGKKNVTGEMEEMEENWKTEMMETMEALERKAMEREEMGTETGIQGIKKGTKKGTRKTSGKEARSRVERSAYASATAHRLASLGNARVTAATTEVLEGRNRVKEKVQRAIRQAFGKQYWVEFFGSTRYGVSHVQSDLDMVILDPAHPHGYVKLKITQPIYNTKNLATALKWAKFTNIESRSRSAVPIVRFTDKTTGIDCDLNVNERLGLVNSDLIKTYCGLNPFLRPLLFVIKEWAKRYQLNSPSTPRVPVSFSSYSLALMSIGFLQSQGMLPNLQDGYAPLTADEEKRHCIWTQKPHQGWDVRFQRSPPAFPGAVAVDRYEMLIRWFRFWGTFSYAEQCIDIRRGGVVPRELFLPSEESKAKAANSPSPICVFDPFIVTKNTTLAVSSKVLLQFQMQCKAAANKIRNSNEIQRAQHWQINDDL